MLEDHIYKFKNKEYGNRLHFYWRVFDDTFIKPWLIRDFDPETQKLKRKLKYEEFGAGRLNLQRELLHSTVFKKSAHTHATNLSDPLINKNQTVEEDENRNNLSNEHTLVVEPQRGPEIRNSDPEDSLLVSTAHVQKQKTSSSINKVTFPNHTTQLMEMRTESGSKAEERKHD